MSEYTLTGQLDWSSGQKHGKQKALEGPKGVTCLSMVVSVKRRGEGNVCLRLASKSVEVVNFSWMLGFRFPVFLSSLVLFLCLLPLLRPASTAVALSCGIPNSPPKLLTHHPSSVKRSRQTHLRWSKTGHRKFWHAEEIDSAHAGTFWHSSAFGC